MFPSIFRPISLHFPFPIVAISGFDPRQRTGRRSRATFGGKEYLKTEKMNLLCSNVFDCRMDGDEWTDEQRFTGVLCSLVGRGQCQSAIPLLIIILINISLVSSFFSNPFYNNFKVARKFSYFTQIYQKKKNASAGIEWRGFLIFPIFNQSGNMQKMRQCLHCFCCPNRRANGTTEWMNG